MSPNTKSMLETGQHPVGTWVSIGHPIVAEVSASCGFDFLVLDMEHTEMGFETVAELVRAVEAVDRDVDVVVRVPTSDPVWLKRALDLGIDGVMVPSVETASEAADVVEATRFPPEGNRGIASVRAADHGLRLEEYTANGRDSLLTVAQVETEPGLENAAAIADVDGVDALFVGKFDLSASLGMFDRRETAEFEGIVDDLVATATAAGVPIGALVVDRDRVAEHVERGFDYLVVGKDTSTLSAAGRRAVEAHEQAIARESRD